MASVSPDPTPEELRAQAERDGYQSMAEQFSREATAFAKAMQQHDATTRLIAAKASLVSALALLILVAPVALLITWLVTR